MSCNTLLFRFPASEPSCPARIYNASVTYDFVYYSWTQWHDRDDGDGTGDIETIALQVLESSHLKTHVFYTDNAWI